MSGCVMTLPDTWEEFADLYKFKDTAEIYTNGDELIQLYRVQQWLDHLDDKKTVCGYPVRELILFAATCQKCGLRPDEVRDTAHLIDRVADKIIAETNSSIEKAIETAFSVMKEADHED